MIKSLRITIEAPCQEKWEEMKAVEKGAFCRSCNKEVTDFTHMNHEELVTYFLNNREGSACGRFRSAQLNTDLIFFAPEVIAMDMPLWKKFIAVFFICFSGFLTGCSDHGSSINYTSLPLPVHNQPKLPTEATQVDSNKSFDVENIKPELKETLILVNGRMSTHIGEAPGCTPSVKTIFGSPSK